MEFQKTELETAAKPASNVILKLSPSLDIAGTILKLLPKDRRIKYVYQGIVSLDLDFQ